MDFFNEFFNAHDIAHFVLDGRGVNVFEEAEAVEDLAVNKVKIILFCLRTECFVPFVGKGFENFIEGLGAFEGTDEFFEGLGVYLAVFG